jgi:uncharacterized protein (DUF362 family)
MLEHTIAIVNTEKEAKYPLNPPFNPPQRYPEYPFGENEIDPSNQVYVLVRELLFYLGLDKENYDKKSWNPLKEIVHPGDKVVIKPNLVLHFNASGEDTNAVITHGSVIRALMDYIFIALQGKGEIIVADAPQMNADFEKIIQVNGLKEVIKYYKSKVQSSDISINIFDIRRERTIYKYGIVWKRIKLNGDPKGYAVVDLGPESEFRDIDCSNIYGADYNRNETQQAHTGGNHKYFISRTILDADIIISIPKMKVHRKAGVTLNLKNIMGISGNKNYILHYRIGTPKEGGDEFPKYYFIDRIDRKLRDLLLGRVWKLGKYPYMFWSKVFNRHKSLIEKGDWYGNDTVWRGVLDLNKILFYADKHGNLQNKKLRRYFSIIDGIIGGEGEGPLAPIPKECGVLIGGTNPLFVDIVVTRLMDFDFGKIPLLRNALRITKLPLASDKLQSIVVKSNINEWENILQTDRSYYQFKPPKGWERHIEL